VTEVRPSSAPSPHLTSPHMCQFCLSDPALEMYQSLLSSLLSPHPKGNKLRDVPERFVTQGHCFSLGDYERELLYSFDVCSGCEAHSILRQLEQRERESNDSGSRKGEQSRWIEERVSSTVPHLDWWQRGGGREAAREGGFARDFLRCPS
jgi:hypothetical protein